MNSNNRGYNLCVENFGKNFVERYHVQVLEEVEYKMSKIPFGLKDGSSAKRKQNYEIIYMNLMTSLFRNEEAKKGLEKKLKD